MNECGQAARLGQKRVRGVPRGHIAADVAKPHGLDNQRVHGVRRGHKDEELNGYLQDERGR